MTLQYKYSFHDCNSSLIKNILDMLLQSKKNNETGLPMDEIDPETKSWYRSLGCKYDKVSEIITNRPSEVIFYNVYSLVNSNIKKIISLS